MVAKKQGKGTERTALVIKGNPKAIKKGAKMLPRAICNVAKRQVFENNKPPIDYDEVEFSDSSLNVQEIMQRLTQHGGGECNLKCYTVVEKFLDYDTPGLGVSYAIEKCKEEFAKMYPVGDLREYDHCKWRIECMLKELYKHKLALRREIFQKSRKWMIEYKAYETKFLSDISARRLDAILKNLDRKTRLLIVVVDELRALNGISIDKYETIIDRHFYNKPRDIVKAADVDPSLAKDKDVKFLCDAFRRARYVHNNN